MTLKEKRTSMFAHVESNVLQYVTWKSHFFIHKKSNFRIRFFTFPRP